MTIKQKTPLTLGEVSDLVGEGEKQDEIKKFIKRFSPLAVGKAKEMKEELEKLEMIQLKGEHIVKIIDFIPKDAADLNRALPDVSLNQDEVNKILEIVKKY